jgi:hypothetical protein
MPAGMGKRITDHGSDGMLEHYRQIDVKIRDNHLLYSLSVDDEGDGRLLAAGRGAGNVVGACT